MAFSVPDRIRIPRFFWTALKKQGLAPAVLLRQAHLPITACEDDAYSLTTAQFFALWRCIGDLLPDPAFGLNFGAEIEFAALPLATLASFHARDYRDALARQVRFNQICTPVETRVQEQGDECVIEQTWLYAVEDEPPLLTDTVLAVLVEVGRRGTQYPICPKRIELKRRAQRTGAHKEYFNCAIDFRASRNAMILHLKDLDCPFATYDAELLEMVQTQLEKKMDGYRKQTSTCEQVKWILRQMLAGGRPEIADVAHELGLSVRTLQRRIVGERATYRELLLEPVINF